MQRRRNRPAPGTLPSLPTLQPIALPIPGFDQLCAASRAEGYNFLDTLAAEWFSGANRFDQPGEILLGALDQGILVAVGGLNRDPFLADPTIGRIRRIYVGAASRNRGIGTALVTSLLDHARQHFATVRLRTDNPTAARLYERLGFQPIADPHATHALTFA
jgi:GNAT superfamily N-acetyltransferase